MKIEKITKLKVGKYKLKFDDGTELITYDDVILNNGLLFNKEIDDDTYLLIKNESEYYKLYHQSIKYITKRLRSEKEMRIYLEKKTSDIYVIDSILIDLKKLNLINDKKFTHAYINDKLNFSNVGINKIRYELKNLGIDLDIIEDEIANFDYCFDNNKLEKMIVKKIKLNRKYSNSVLKQKIINDMINLGYDKQDIIEICDRNMQDDSEIYKQEYEKIYNKLKLKYSGSELEYRVKQKLHSKGFSKEN